MSLDPLRERCERLLLVAVLLVEESQIDSGAPGQGKGPPILLEALAYPLRGIRRARVAIPPRRTVQAGRDAGEDVDDKHIAGLGEQMPTRQDGVI